MYFLEIFSNLLLVKIRLVFAARELNPKMQTNNLREDKFFHGWSLLTTNPIIAKYKQCHHTCEKVHCDPGQHS